MSSHTSSSHNTRQKVTSIDILKEILELLKITEKNTLEETKIIQIALSNILRVQILAALIETTLETAIPKGMILDSE